MAFFDLISTGGGAQAFDEYNRAAQKYTLEAQARDPEWQAWSAQASGLPLDLQGSIASPDKDYTAEFFASLSPEQQREYWQLYEQHQADKAKSWQSKVAGVMKFIPAAVGVAGLAGAAGLLGGAPGGVSAGAIQSAAGLPELGLAGQTGLTGGATGALGAAGGAMNWMDLIGPAASVGGALIGSNAAGNAADSQAAATNAAIAEQRRQFDLTRGDFAPYREIGVNALRQYAGEIDRMPTPEEVMADPGYQFGMQQGQRGVDNKIAAMGGRASGQAIKAASRFNTGFASGMYGDAYQRSENRKNRIAALGNIGQTSTGAMTLANQNSVNNISRLTDEMGGVNAATKYNQGSIWGNAINQVGAQVDDYYRNRSRVPTVSKSDPWAYWE